MFADPLQANFETAFASQDPVERGFSLVSTGPTSSIRRCINGLPGLPNTLKISHTNVGKGDTARVRHLVRLETNKVLEAVPLPGSEDVQYYEGAPIASAYLVVDVPIGWENTSQSFALIKQLMGLLRGSSAGRAEYQGDTAEPTEEQIRASFFSGLLNGLV